MHIAQTITSKILTTKSAAGPIVIRQKNTPCTFFSINKHKNCYNKFSGNTQENPWLMPALNFSIQTATVKLISDLLYVSFI